MECRYAVLFIHSAVLLFVTLSFNVILSVVMLHSNLQSVVFIIIMLYVVFYIVILSVTIRVISAEYILL